MKRFGVLLASAALAASGPAAAMGDFGGGHIGGFGGGHMAGFGGRSVGVGNFNRSFGFNRDFNPRFAHFDQFHQFHHFHNRFASFPFFAGGGWDHA